MRDKGNVILPLFGCAASPAISHWQQVSIHPIAYVMTATYPLGLFAVKARGGCYHGNLRVLSREEIVQKKIWVQTSAFVEVSIFFPPSLHLTILFSLPFLSHILTLSIYLYSHLFTFLFKIFVYKCVYKLKIISSCPVSKWHLQGKGCVGLRFLIALQEPTTRQHRTPSKCVWNCFSADSGCQPKLWVTSHLCISFYMTENDSWSWSLSGGRYKDIVSMNTHAYHTEMY